MDAKTFVTVAKIMVNRTKYDIKYGIWRLSKLLRDHLMKRIYILIDDYDIPYNHRNKSSVCNK